MSDSGTCPIRRTIAPSAILLLLALSHSAHGGEGWQSARNRAVDALRQGRPTDARTILETALQDDPGAIELLDLLVKACQQSGDEERALKIGERILRAFPAEHRVRLWLSQLLEKRGRLDEAKEHLEALLAGGKAALPPDAAKSARLGLGRVLFASGKPAEARKSIQPLLESGSSLEATILEIRCFREENRLDLAIRAARAGLPSIPDGKVRLASLLRDAGLDALRSGDPGSAIEPLQESVSLRPEVGTRRDLARALWEADRKEEAARQLESLLEESGPAAIEDVAQPLGDIYLESGQAEKALDLAVKVLERHNTAGFAEAIRGRALAALGREEEFLEILPRLAGDFGGHPRQAAALLLAADSLKRFPEAIDSWMKNAASFPDEIKPILARLLAKSASIHRSGGETQRAGELCRRSLALAPGNLAALGELGLAEMEKGSAASALRAWEPVLEAGQGSITVITGAVRACRELGQPERGIQLAAGALKKNPEARSLRGLYWRLLDESSRDNELLAELDPDRMSCRLLPEDGTSAAPIFYRRIDEAPIRSLLESWLALLPEHHGLQRAKARRLYIDAQEARARRDSDAAIALLRSSLDLDPESTTSLQSLARVLMASGDSNGAIQALLSAERLQPENPGPKALRVRALREQGRTEEAWKAIARVDPAIRSSPLMEIEAAQLEFDEGKLSEVVARARRLMENHPESPSVDEALLLIADALADTGQVLESLDTIEQLIARQPGNKALLTRYLHTAIYLKVEPRAVHRLEKLALLPAGRAAALLVLAAHFLSRNELERAQDLLKAGLELYPNDATQWVLLGEARMQRREPASARNAFRSALKLAPGDTRAIFGCASAESALDNPEDALASCAEVLARNPSQRGAYIFRSKILEAAGDVEGALAELESAEEILPDDLDNPFQHARLFSVDRRHGEAIELMDRLIEQSADGCLPILLYHGVSRHLAADAMPAHLFRDQMQALVNAGYHTIGLEETESWLKGQRPLPDKAILITFDDARLDNKLAAEPILKEFGIRAVQFVPTAFISDHRSFYLSWKDMKELAATGRWEFGSHGHVAHRLIHCNPEGAEGIFLVARAWLPDKGRMETMEEMEARIALDHRTSKARLVEELGNRAAATYSFPFGSIGQRDVTNEPQAYTINIRQYKENYTLGFRQSESGYNLRRRSLTILDRFQVPEDWGGRQLITHLRSMNPLARAHLERGIILSSSGRHSKGIEEIDKAEALGASRSEVLSARAHALLWRGDRLLAVAEFRKLLEFDTRDPRIHDALIRAERADSPEAGARLEIAWDRRHRLVTREILSGEGNALPWLRLHGEAGHALYRESGSIDIDGAMAKVGGLASLPGAVEIEAAGGGTLFDGAQDVLSYDTAIRYRGIDRFFIEAGADGGPVQTPRAVLEGIRLDIQSAAAVLSATRDDRISGSYRHAFYSDANDRNTVKWEYGHRFLDVPDLQLGYSGSYDSTRKEVEEYYSPQKLHLHQGFARVGITVLESLSLNGRFGLGYGWEEERESLTGDGSIEARWRYGERFEISGEISHFRNPRYWGSAAGINLLMRF